MRKPPRVFRWPRPQFTLRFLFSAVTLLAIAISVGMVWWQMPYDVEKIITDTDWRDPWEGSRCCGSLSTTLAPPAIPKFRQVSHVYNSLSGEIVLHGPLQLWDMQGHRLRLENWEHGQRHGKFWNWTRQGELLESGEYWHGKKHGHWRDRAFGSRGACMLEIWFDHGVKQKTIFTAENGDVDETHFKDGRPDGPTRGRYANGAKKYVRSWRHDKEHGHWQLWAPDGRLTCDIEFRDGRVLRSDGTLTPEIVVQNFDDSRRTRITLAELQQPTRGEFIKAPLSHTIQFFEDYHKIDIRLDQARLKLTGVSNETPITYDLQLTSLRGGFAVLLNSIARRDVIIVIRNEMLLITAGDDQLHWRDRTGVPRLLADRGSPWAHKFAEQTTLEFNETPLPEVFAYLSHTHHIQIGLDQSKFDPAVAIQDRAISVDVSGISLAAALTMILDENNLAVEARGLELVVVPVESVSQE